MWEERFEAQRARADEAVEHARVAIAAAKTAQEQTKKAMSLMKQASNQAEEMATYIKTLTGAAFRPRPKKPASS